MKIENSKIDFKYNIKMYWSVLKNYKPYIFGIIFCILIIESLNILTRYLFKIITDNATIYANAEISKEVFLFILLNVGISYGIIVATLAFLRWLYNRFITKMETKIMFDVKQKFLDHLIKLSYNFHTTHKTGSLISKLVRSGSAIERMTDTLVFNFIPLVFQLAITGITLAYFDVSSLIILMAIVVAFITANLIINKIREPYNIQANDAEDYEKGQIADVFTNIESIKLFGKEKNMKVKYDAVGNKTREAYEKYWSYYGIQGAINNLIIGIGTILIVYFPAMKFANGQITLGTLVFIYTTYLAIVQSLYGIDHAIKSYYRSMADFESLFQYAKVENEIKDKTDSTTLKVESGEVEFKNVKFSYNNNAIFENFNLKIPKNKKVAIIGPSGAGKTSLIRLIYRLYDVESGEILVDGRNINSFIQESLRSELSIVPQECVLFDDTIYNNILFSRPEASREEVMQAMRFAQLDKIVDSFPNKENTIVGERGVKLSGGEKQRVSIARAILADKKILILDEATSSLDSETESEIQKDLHNLMQGRTSIIIAHRLSTIMSADIIVVIEKGRIAQMGNHKTLIKKKGLYKKLWDLQKGGYIE